MASTIQTQTIGSADKCIALAASQFGRAHGYGDNWNTLRVAMLFNVEDTGGAGLAGLVFRFGLCSGTAAMPGDLTTQNSYGIQAYASWSRSAGNYAAGYSNSAFSRVGSVNSSLYVTSIGALMFQTSSKRMAWFIDVIKGSPNYTFKMFYNSNASTSDMTPAAFVAQIGTSSPASTNYVYSAAVGSLAVDVATNGILDTVYCGWNLVTPRLFISNLAVVRLA